MGWLVEEVRSEAHVIGFRGLMISKRECLAKEDDYEKSDQLDYSFVSGYMIEEDTC